AEAARNDLGLLQETARNDRYRRKAGTLDRRTRPQHGGRAGTSGAHAGDDGMDRMLAERRGHISEHLFLTNAVRVAERVVRDEPHTGISVKERFAYRREDLFSPKHAIPHFADRLAVQVADGRIQWAFVPVRFPEWPHDFVEGLAFAHGSVLIRM